MNKGGRRAPSSNIRIGNVVKQEETSNEKRKITILDFKAKSAH